MMSSLFHVETGIALNAHEQGVLDLGMVAVGKGPKVRQNLSVSIHLSRREQSVAARAAVEALALGRALGAQLAAGREFNSSVTAKARDGFFIVVKPIHVGLVPNEVVHTAVARPVDAEPAAIPMSNRFGLLLLGSPPDAALGLLSNQADQGSACLQEAQVAVAVNRLAAVVGQSKVKGLGAPELPHATGGNEGIGQRDANELVRRLGMWVESELGDPARLVGPDAKHRFPLLDAQGPKVAVNGAGLQLGGAVPGARIGKHAAPLPNNRFEGITVPARRFESDNLELASLPIFKPRDVHAPVQRDISNEAECRLILLAGVAEDEECVIRDSTVALDDSLQQVGRSPSAADVDTSWAGNLKRVKHDVLISTT